MVYKCEESASNCGLCLSIDDNLKCGWCSSMKQCTVFEKCTATLSTWLDKNDLCPWPEITKVHSNMR